MAHRPGSISEDARGRWYLNVSVKVPKATLRSSADALANVKTSALGIDLGLKSLLKACDGTEVEAQQFYRDLEPALATAQRARKVKRVRAIHAKIANRRKDHLHKLSTALVKDHRAIFVGDVNAQALTQTRMAKSVLDAGWSAFRTMLKYKSDDAGVWFKEVDEKFSTQECSA
ncbi:transposase, partial [Nostoc sp. CHAB 5834]|nr:transposase [Nostoc sp. CHAB 5834]